MAVIAGSDPQSMFPEVMIDADACIALDGTFVKLVAWYDNAWGYLNKCLEMVRVVAKQGHTAATRQKACAA